VIQKNVDIRAWIADCGAEWLECFDLKTDRISTALILAISFGDWASTQILASSQDDIDERDRDGDWTALMYAVHEKCLKTVKLLVDLGADVNLLGTFEPEEDFALNLAAYKRNQAIFDLLFPLTSPELQEVATKTWQLHVVV
jgi:ankyrin repeat protein